MGGAEPNQEVFRSAPYRRSLRILEQHTNVCAICV
jgi:hypothetical protein